MTTIANPELHAFQKAVRDHAKSIAETNYSAGPYVDRFLSALGLDNLVEDVQVTVTVTVPATDAATAQAEVDSQIRSLYLPTGWTAEVSSS